MACFVCAHEDVAFSPTEDPETGNWRCTCSRCGAFEVSAEAKDEVTKLPEKDRLRLSFAIRRATDEHGRRRELITSTNYRSTIAEIQIPDALDQTELLIGSIAERSRFFEPTPQEHREAWAARTFFPSWIQLRGMTNSLHERRVLFQVQEAVQIRLSLTLDGWERAREIRKQRGPGNQAFVAMWFHDDMAIAFDKGFKLGLEDTGYSAYKVDRAPHNNRIDDEIVAQIRRSKILVADATGVRASAYYEAGLAEGLGLPVLWCCNDSFKSFVLDVDPNIPTPPKPRRIETWFSVAAFDTNHHVFLFWKDPADLRHKLATRIRALDLDLTIRAQPG